MKARFDPARRRIVVCGARIVGAVVATSVAVASTGAAAKASKSELMYQDRRHEGKGCGDCKFFSSATSASDVGQCSVVEGSVRRDGWCLAFSPSTSP